MFKSTDEKITTDLIQVLRDGEKGFAAGAEKLRDTTRSDMAPMFSRFAEQRAQFAVELEHLAAQYGDSIDENGSIIGALHRGWMTVTDALTGDDPDGVISAAATGEQNAVSTFENALAADISDHLRTVVTRQYTEIKAVADQIKSVERVLT